MPKDLRSYLAQQEAAGKLFKIIKEVDPRKEISALSCQVPQEMTTFFEKLKGFPGWRACIGTLDTRAQVAQVLGIPLEKLLPAYAEITNREPIPYKVVSDGPVKERIFKGDEVDLLSLPVPVVSERDAGPYFTFSETISRNPDNGAYNAAVVRLQLKGRNKTGIYMIRGRHTWENYKKYEAKNEAMPVAVVIGHHPAFHLIGTWSGSYEVDELGLVGSLMGEPLRVVKCETSDLLVPADAEAIIEGEIPPKVREMEGSFAEFTLYYPTPYEEPIINVKAITMRKDPIFEFSVRGRPQVQAGLGICQYLYRRIREVEGFIDLKDVRIYPQVDSFMVVVQFTPHYEGQAKNVLMAALSGTTLHPKIAIAVDDDVDIDNPTDVWWAVTNRTNPERDVFIIGGTRNHPFDLKLPLDTSGTVVQRIGSKMGIDATKPPTSKPDERAKFDRARPVGWQTVKLEDFL